MPIFRPETIISDMDVLAGVCRVLRRAVISYRLGPKLHIGCVGTLEDRQDCSVGVFILVSLFLPV